MTTLLTGMPCLLQKAARRLAQPIASGINSLFSRLNIELNKTKTMLYEKSYLTTIPFNCCKLSKALRGDTNNLP
jgi:hypothetical protein